MLPFPTKENPKFYKYDNKYDDKEWGTELRNIYVGDVGLDSNTLVYAEVDTLEPYIQLPTAYWDKYIAYMQANHTEMQCVPNFLGMGMCQVTGKTCAQLNTTYPNLTIRFNDTLGFVVPPTSYLKDQKTSQGTPMCYNMVMGKLTMKDKIILGDVFMENYQVLFDYEDTTISFNGWILEDLNVEPEKPKSGTMVIGVIIGVGVAVLVVAIIILVVIKKRNAKLHQRLSQYNKLEESSSATVGEIYEKPSITKK
jgi:Xylanase inhibitor C-terminal